MAVPSTSSNFGDLLDPVFQQIFNDELDSLPDMLPTLFTFPPMGQRGDSTKWSDVGAFDTFDEFTGSVNYDDVSQGYDVTATHLEFASGFQVERKLFDDDRHDVMNEKPSGLADAAVRTRQEHGAEVFNGAFSASSGFYSHSEGVALCSNSHTTTSEASTASGFDNLTTSALTHTAVTAARIQFRGFRGDRAERRSFNPDELWYPVDLYAQADEILKSIGRHDSADRTMNVHQGAYTGRDWEYLSDTNDWYMTDSRNRKKMLYWIDRVGLEFAFAEDLDSIIAKWRAYMRYSWAWRNWRWVLGAQVS